MQRTSNEVYCNERWENSESCCIIDIEVAYLKGTLFSDMNATKTGHKTGGALNDLSKVRFDIVKLPNHFNLEEPEKSFYQAEILVKTFIPKRYIVNLDNF